MNTVPLNIAVISVDALPFTGGVSHMAHYLTEAFTRLGHKCVFIGPRGSYVPAELERHYHLYDDFQSDKSKRSAAVVHEEDRRIGNVLRAVFEEYQIDRVLLAHPFYYGVMAMDIGEEMGIPVSALFHGFEIRSQLTGGYPDELAKLLEERRVETLADRAFYVVGKADELLANSSYTAQILEGFGTGAPVHVTGCGVDDNFPDGPEVRPERPGSGDLFTIVSVGRLVSHKKVDRLIDMVAADTRLRAVIIGEGPELDALQAKVPATASDRVVFTGLVSEEVKWRHIADADAIALLSEPNDEFGQVEGFGIVLLEGALGGCIPVTSGTGGMTDVVSDGHTGIVLEPALDAVASAARLVDTLSQPQERERLLNGAREQIRTRYNWDVIAAGMAARWLPAKGEVASE